MAISPPRTIETVRIEIWILQKELDDVLKDIADLEKLLKEAKSPEHQAKIKLYLWLLRKKGSQISSRLLRLLNELRQRLMKMWFGDWPPKRKPRSEEDEDRSVFPPSGADLPLDSFYYGNGTLPAFEVDIVDHGDTADSSALPLIPGSDFIAFNFSGDGELEWDYRHEPGR